VALHLKAILAGATLILLLACYANLLPQPASGQPRKGPAASGEFMRPTDDQPPDRSPLKLPLTRPKIVVKKGRRELLLFSADKLVRRYRIGLGLNPVGDKVREGDRRTPEGDFYIFTKNDKSAFYLSLGISYPNNAAAERGLRDHLITRSQYDAIMQALRAKKAPPQNTPLGGEIYIHGNGAGSDWTWGCVALENEDVRELFNAVSVGTPMTIEP
jgi:lipoprotein-anchoring transpeptidase ErfK/SrfK